MATHDHLHRAYASRGYPAVATFDCSAEEQEAWLAFLRPVSLSMRATAPPHHPPPAFIDAADAHLWLEDHDMPLECVDFVATGPQLDPPADRLPPARTGDTEPGYSWPR